ncbi:energy transducer TonB [Hymenobacter nivis]|nr:energy transducer TonB [Hymenobacter nivis]
MIFCVLLILALSSAATAGALAQVPPARPDTTFFDAGWHHLGRPNAVFFGWVTPLDSGRCRIQTYYLTGERQFDATGRLGPPVQRDGPATFYYRSGQVHSTGQYAQGKQTGSWQYWQEDGTPKLTRTYVPRPPTPDGSVPQFVEQMPVFAGGMAGLARYLATHAHYPSPIDKTQPRPAGRVFVQFVVGPTGDVLRPVVIKGFDPACDAEALRVVASLPRWEPGRRNGEPVEVRFVVPLIFHP